MLLAVEGSWGEFTLESIGWWSELTMHEEVMVGFRVELECVMSILSLWPSVWVRIVYI